ncbi:MAG: DUF1893 domain-containing protein [candidate division Zixibacteria bacterium]
MDLTLRDFLNSKFSLVAVRDGSVVFQSEEHDLVPLLALIGDETMVGNLTIFDRFVGRAAGLLFTLIRPTEIKTGMISQAGFDLLNQSGIRFEAVETVDYLMGAASEGMCRWEKLSIGLNAEEFLKKLRELEDG